MADVRHKLHVETKAAEVLREHLRDVAGEDADLVRDCIEGETRLHEMIDAAVAQISADTAHIKGIKAHMVTLKSRQSRLEERIDAFRAAIQTAMQVAELKSRETPLGTVSLKKVPPSVQIVDEAQIPAEFWKAQDPKLDKKAVLDALKEKRAVEGATLTNGGETLSLRWS